MPLKSAAIVLVGLFCVVPSVFGRTAILHFTAVFALVAVALRFLRLYPRKVVDIGWLDLAAAFRYGLWDFLVPWKGTSSASLEASIARQWSPRGDGVVCLCVRSAFDLTLEALALPRGTEVLFAPGITIPAMVKIVEARGLRAVSLEPPSTTNLLPSVADLKAHLSENTKVLVVTHLFGAVFDAVPLIREAQRHGLFVFEDCAQSFVGASTTSAPGAPAGGGLGTLNARGFRGHAQSDAAFVSFGLIKTHTCLGGAVGHIRDVRVRSKVAELQRKLSARLTRQFVATTLRAIALKTVGSPGPWGVLAALSAAVGVDFDKAIIDSVRGFPTTSSFRLRPSLPLLRLLHRRLGDQSQASLGPCGASASSMELRRAAGACVVQRLLEGGVEAVGGGSSSCSSNTWWLMPMLSKDPRGLARRLQARGFDATSTSTQLDAVASCSLGGAKKGFATDLMRQIVYLPVTPQLNAWAADGLVAGVLEHREAGPRGGDVAPGTLTAGTRLGLRLLASAVVLALFPRLVRYVGRVVLPSPSFVILALLVLAGVSAVLVRIGRWLADTRGLRIDRETLQKFTPRSRPEGIEFWKARPPIKGRIDGAVLVTGASGFVGEGVLFGLLARANELGVTKIVLIIRRKAGISGEARLAHVRASPIFDEVRDTFERLVSVLEGDVAEKDFGWRDSQRAWPYEEPLRAVLHCAGDVSFDQPLRQAALSLISASLQTAQLAARWEAQRFVLVSTAFVHAVPSAGTCLQERLVELRDFDPMELYRDAIADGKWAEKAMRELGFPNTYTFAKAVAEHLVLRVCAAENVEAHIVRPSIVGPAWGAPFAGWCGDKPSTVVGAAVLLAVRGLRVFRSSQFPCPIVPVDFVAEAVLEALAAPCRGIINATVDASEADLMFSFRSLMDRLFQVAALRGDLTLPEAGFLHRAIRWADNGTAFWALHVSLNVMPAAVATSFCKAIARSLSLVGLSSQVWDKVSRRADLLLKFSRLPAQYMPFSYPSSPWLFQSGLRLPADWNQVEYAILIYRGAISFARSGLRNGPSRNSAELFREFEVVAPRSVCSDALATFCKPGAPFHQSCAAFLIRRAFGWMHLRATMDIASLEAVTQVAEPLVLCPQHRSLLDFVILGAACFQVCPSLPAVQVPHVAADAEFSGLPVLGRVLKALGAFFVRRGGGAVQPDPALRTEVGRVFREGRPIEVFLEGLRSRGRRQLRLRSGLLRALRDVAQRRVALLPVGLSYEFLPEDRTFLCELRGEQRPPLSTLAFIDWVFRGVSGELPPLGNAHVRFGKIQTLDAASELLELLADVQDQLVALTSITALHTQALAEVLDLPPDAVRDAFIRAKIPVRPSSLVLSGGAARAIDEAARWPLALQAATLLRDRLPERWARWLVEPVLQGHCTGASLEEDMHCAVVPKFKGDGCDPVLDVDGIVASLSLQFKAAEDAARAAVDALLDSGVVRVKEEHLLQQLLRPCAEKGLAHEPLPPLLARGAASIVAAQLPTSATTDDAAAEAGVQPGPPNAVEEPARVVALWPTDHQARSSCRSDEEALDRWGFKDTRFVANWADGRPIVQVTSTRYASVGGRPLHKLWPLFQKELGMTMNVRATLADNAFPELPLPAPGLVATLEAALPKARIRTDVEARLRAGTGHGLQDIWRLRTREVSRMPDAVVRPESEEEVLALLKAAACDDGSNAMKEDGVAFAVVPVGGRTNVTSATAVPDVSVDPRPFVALDMRGLSSVVWVNAEDRVAMAQAGIRGSELKEVLSQHGLNMGMEPDSMEFSTLGGWIATRASGMKRSRYGNIEDMVVEVRVATAAGLLWQHHDSASVDVTSDASSQTAFGRVSTNLMLPSIILGSEGCLGVVVAAVIRVHPLPEVVKYESVVFPDWDRGAAWMRNVAGMPAALRPASCRLMDSTQLKLAAAIREETAHGPFRSALRTAFLRANGIRLEEAAAATLVFEGTRDEVAAQVRALVSLVRDAGGVWGGKDSGEAGYALTFAIAYLRDFGLDYHILSESLETMAPWSKISQVWPAVVAAVEAEHQLLRLPGRPFLSCRMTQLYTEGGVLYMYLAVCTAGLRPSKALEAFERLEHAAREAAMAAGGCLSHHHGVGKLRAALLPRIQAPALSSALVGVKKALDPNNVLGAANGAWALAGNHIGASFFDMNIGQAPMATRSGPLILGEQTSSNARTSGSQCAQA